MLSVEQKPRIVDISTTRTRPQVLHVAHLPNKGVCALGCLVENHPDFGNWCNNVAYSKSGDYMSLFSVWEYYGLTLEEAGQIARMNDYSRMSFLQIGTYINVNWFTEGSL